MKIKTTSLIGFQALLFGLFLIVAYYFNRFAGDDYQLIGLLREATFSELYHRLYVEWHGRWTSNFMLTFLLQFNAVPGFLFMFNAITTLLLFFSAKGLLSALNTRYAIAADKKILAFSGLVFMSVFFFTTVSANDVWFWYTSTVIYLWSAIAFFTGLQAFIQQKKTTLNYLIMSLSAIYIGGSNEPLAIACILLLLFGVLKKKALGISILALVLIGASFLINYLSPGTQHRDFVTPSLSFLDVLLYTGYGSLDYLFFSFHLTFLPALFLGLPFFLLGQKTTHIIVPSFLPRKQLYLSLGFLLMVVGFNQLLVVFALGGLAPERSTMTSSIAITLLLIRYLFLWGNTRPQLFPKIKIVLGFNVMALLIFGSYFTVIHSNYAQALDDRVRFAKENDQELILLSPLPYSGYIYSAEITTDTAHFKNQHFKNGLGLKSEVVLGTD